MLKFITFAVFALFINSDLYLSVKRYEIPIENLCVFRKITGFPCPSCGMTRAHIELLKADFAKALEYHPLFILPSLVLITIIFSKKIKILNRIIKNNFIIISFIAIFLTVYILRFINLFPNEEPFLYDYDSYIYILLDNYVFSK